MKNVLVLGASGEMGRRVVLLADRLVPDARIVLGVHRTVPWPNREIRRVELSEPTSLAHALDGIDAIVNVVGPYSYDPEPLILACLAAGCHYVDLAEEPGFIARVQNVSQPPGAAARPLAIVPGCSTLPGLVEVLAQPWADQREVAHLRIFLSMGSSNPVAPGLMYGLLRPLGRRDWEGHRSFTRLRRRAFHLGASRIHGSFPSPLGASGLRLGDRHVSIEVWVGFDRAWLNVLLFAVARPLGMVPDRWLRRIVRATLPVMPAVRRMGTSRGYLAVEARDGQDRILDAVEIRADREGLDVAALPSVWAVHKLLESTPHSGLVSLNQLVTFEEAAASLEQEGYTVRRLSVAERRI